mgnify:CR=1 FL=1
MTRKLDKNNIEEIKKLQENFNKTFNILGNIVTEQHVIKQQLIHLKQEKQEYLNEINELRKQENELLTKLKEKYGDGQININEGTFTSL